MGCGGSKGYIDTYDHYSEALNAGILPSPDALDISNVLSRYTFGKGIHSDGTAPIYPSFHGASCRNPMTGAIEHFLCVGVHTAVE
mmetsp:Transcript_72817/g.199805  ORF Transcript_72817/g.199805 Transcript_72817/m.199805 type:complete len:85 (+) Transcript_72817:110-364(+)